MPTSSGVWSGIYSAMPSSSPPPTARSPSASGAMGTGIKEIILCADNKKDVDDIKADYLKGLSFNYVSQMTEVIQLALLK